MNTLQGRRNRPRRIGHIARDAAIRARSAVFAGVLLAAGAVPPELDASDEAPAPIVVHADRWQPWDVPEAMSLAARLLQREGIEPPPNDAARRPLAREIAAALSRIRGEYPEVADVVARETYARPGGVILTLEPGLLGSVSRGLVGGRSAPVTLRTGHVRFDALNAALGLRAVEVFPSFGAVAFFFDPPVDPPFDVDDVMIEYSWYSRIDEILSVEPNVYLFDGPDLDLSRSEKTWKFVFRNTWGDCPLRCRFHELLFFSVESGKVEKIDPARAMVLPGFAEIVARRGWRATTRPRYPNRN